MVYMHIGGRGTGKTSWLIEQYKKDPGMFIVADYKAKIYDQVEKPDLFNRLVPGIPKGRPIYIDCAGDVDYINYNVIITLDSKGNDFYITGPLNSNSRGYENFLEYLKNFYPEYLI